MTKDELAAIFTEWWSQWEADPDSFSTIGSMRSAETYGERCAEEFLRIKAELE